MRNDKDYDSIMSSKRWVNEIWVSGHVKNIDIDRLLAILKKFKPFLKKFDARIYSCSRENCFSILDAASDIEELTLDLTKPFQEIEEPFVSQLKKFSKLKRLDLRSCRGAQNFFDAIPDDSLENLSFIDNDENQISDVSFQSFLNRQKKIRKLDIDLGRNINIDHLILEKLRNCHLEDSEDNQSQLRLLLEKQHELRCLDISQVNEPTFAKICHLTSLESLTVFLLNGEEKSCVRDLSNLRNLTHLDLRDGDESESEYWPGSSYLAQAKLPKLQKLLLHVNDLDPQHFAAMSLGMTNLQKLEIYSGTPDLLQHIERFQALKAFKMEVKYDVAWRNGSSGGNSENGSDQSGEPHFNPLLFKVLKIFQKSENLVSLLLYQVPGFKKRFLEDFFGKDIDELVIYTKECAPDKKTFLCIHKNPVCEEYLNM